jgi:glycosyltransferase involved in cell wall biosynthesis
MRFRSAQGSRVKGGGEVNGDSPATMPDELPLTSVDHVAYEAVGIEAPFEGAASPKSILFVSWRDLANPLAGGSELVIHQLAAGLAQRGCEVSLLCGGPVERNSLYRVQNSGGQYSQYLRAPVHYLRTFRSADLVVEVCNGMPFMAPLWRRGPTVCMVMHVHGEQWSSRFGPMVAACGRFVESDVMPRVHRKNLVVTISESSQSALMGIGVPQKNIRVIPHGVAEPPPLVDKSPLPRFVAVGRLVGYKRIDLLLEMWESVRQQTGGVLTIVGDGPDRERLESTRVEGVEFTGYVSEAEKHRLVSEARILLHPASWEGWGLVITEAAVRGTPAVGFDVPGVRDAIVDSETGLLAADSESFKRHWIRLAEDEELYERFREAGIKRALSHPVNASVNEFERIAAEAMVRHHARLSNGRNRESSYEERRCAPPKAALSE